MIKALIHFLRSRGRGESTEYTGFSDFFLHASTDEKKKVLTEAALRANEDQLKIFKEAKLKMHPN